MLREAYRANAQREVVDMVVRRDHRPDGTILVGYLGNLNEKLQGGVVYLDIVKSGATWSIRYVKFDVVLCIRTGGDVFRSLVQSRKLNGAHVALRGIDK